MKIEKISDTQIRCTLTREDLEKHQLRISELAYGTEKAKKLFRDMMQQAQIQCGFEADNTPLMIEAIPVNMESVILIITKVEDPEELDTRFSKFSPVKSKEVSEPIQIDGADNIIDMFQKLVEAKLRGDSSSVKENQKSLTNTSDDSAQVPAQDTAADASSPQTPAKDEDSVSIDLIRIYTFGKLDHVIDAAHALNGFYKGKNDLYKVTPENFYALVIHQSDASPEDFNRVCNILSEYGQGNPLQPSGEAHLKEHGKLITHNAIQGLAQL